MTADPTNLAQAIDMAPSAEHLKTDSIEVAKDSERLVTGSVNSEGSKKSRFSGIANAFASPFTDVAEKAAAAA